MGKQRVIGLILGVVATTAAVHGCQPAPESFCIWAADLDNCARQFHGQATSSGDGCVPPGSPTPIDPTDPVSPNGVSNGTFLSRYKLDTCFIAGGGQIVFDPPIDADQYPPPSGAAPITYAILIQRVDGTYCASISYTTERTFSFALYASPVGTYAQEDLLAEQKLAVICPDGTIHIFDASETADCPQSEALLPRASLVINPGGVGSPGGVSLTVTWPAAKGPETTTYFNCAIPGGGDCLNGTQDGGETDVDCGGKEILTGCPARCGEGQVCIDDCDCAVGFGCTVVSGERRCEPSDASAAGTSACYSVMTCQDGVKDGDEEDVDCGGSCPTPCATGCYSCNIDSDCLSLHCVNGCCTP